MGQVNYFAFLLIVPLHAPHYVLRGLNVPLLLHTLVEVQANWDIQAYLNVLLAMFSHIIGKYRSDLFLNRVCIFLQRQCYIALSQ